jgi:inhibitor of cysteine peptidase
MMRKLQRAFIMLVILLAILTLASCQSGDANYSASDNGTKISIKPGETFTIELEGNPTTGYSWEIFEVDPEIIMPVGDPEYNSDSDLIGSGGKFIFTLKAQQAGETHLSMGYHRPWEEDVKPLETFNLDIIVAD